MASVAQWAEQFADGRGKKVVFLSHCLLNENTRYLGGACERGASLPVVRACLDRGYGIVQMPCPEQHAWGGVLKRHMLRFFGSRDTVLSRTQSITIPLLIWYTRYVYRRLARRVTDEVAEYESCGFKVVGFVAVDGSPSCGSTRTVDIHQCARLVATLTPASTRHELNALLLSAVSPGSGLFVEALRAELARRKLHIPFLAFDLFSELQGQSVEPNFGDA